MRISSIFNSTNVCHLPVLQEGHKAKFIAKIMGLVLFHTLTLGSVLVYHNIRYHSCSSGLNENCASAVSVAQVYQDISDGLLNRANKLMDQLKHDEFNVNCLINYLANAKNDSNVVQHVIFTLQQDEFNLVQQHVDDSLLETNSALSNSSDANGDKSSSFQALVHTKSVLVQLSDMIIRAKQNNGFS